MKQFLHFLWKWLIIVLLTCSMVSVISSFISPEYFWGLYFFSYGIPFFLVLNSLMLFLCFFIKKHFWLITLSTVISIYGISNNWSWAESKDDGTANYSLMTYNVRLFDFYNWLEGKSWEKWKARSDNGTTLDSLYQTIKASNTDFLCIQEYFNQTTGAYTSNKFMRSIGYSHKHVEYSVKRGSNLYGIATFSKYPIIKKQVKFFLNKGGPKNGILISDIKTKNDTLRIINVHLESFRLQKEDYKYLNDLTDSTLSKVEMKPTKILIDKIRQATKRRAPQLEYLEKVIKESPFPVLLCGDFNDLPNSYLYRRFTEHMKDSFQEVGKGFGSTWVSNLPALRIDYVFHSNRIKAVSHKVIPRILSDHYPVVFEFKKN